MRPLITNAEIRWIAYKQAPNVKLTISSFQCINILPLVESILKITYKCLVPTIMSAYMSTFDKSRYIGRWCALIYLGLCFSDSNVYRHCLRNNSFPICEFIPKIMKLIEGDSISWCLQKIVISVSFSWNVSIFKSRDAQFVDTRLEQRRTNLLQTTRHAIMHDQNVVWWHY